MFPTELGRLQWFLITLYGSLYNTLVQCWTHVALICLTFFSRCLGPIINQKRTLIFWYHFSTISVFSSLCWVASALRFNHLSTCLSPLSSECLVWGSLWRLIDQVSPCSSNTDELGSLLKKSYCWYTDESKKQKQKQNVANILVFWKFTSY